MAETSDQESKTEEPTEKKVRDALEQGKIPVSREHSIGTPSWFRVHAPGLCSFSARAAPAT
ncbi:hypothetical protein DCG74_36260 [Bradyrhizobium sp. WBAH42]|nr:MULTISPECIES: hypothetical protein [Bradyrhizobium]QCJ74636.1 hypothetical protein DAA51_13145 [Bradyrhizobium sp. WBAH10]QCJ81999.1 hypothetical protein DAA53_13160 [Bradyrhizobium sp. WBAH23]QCJ89364.1 hypothetical protein DAA57_13235 [Bradyrhizobium yuanmingense]QCJ96738.1 hypothetical protein DAA61_13120 [Bradyrhizobium sp. WBAH33]QCK04107.1 hypothetical protein DAB18_13150 [Bradyrhizobium sp. WBAH41]